VQAPHVHRMLACPMQVLTLSVHHPLCLHTALTQRGTNGQPRTCVRLYACMMHEL